MPRHSTVVWTTSAPSQGSQSSVHRYACVGNIRGHKKAGRKGGIQNSIAFGKAPPREKTIQFSKIFNGLKTSDLGYESF